MNAYCLFCQTQKAHIVANALQSRGVHRAFSPIIIKRQRIQGENVEKEYNLLPGYVFAYDDQVLNFRELLRGVPGMIRRLGKAEEWFRLENTDYEFAMRLYERDGVIGRIPVFREGDQVLLADELFHGCQAVVTKMDYKKQRARVKFRFAGGDCFTWIACEMMEKRE